MTNKKHGARALTPSACSKKAAGGLTLRHLELIRTAGEAYHRLLTIDALAPEWAPAHAKWLDLAETLAVALVKQIDQLEARQ